MSKFKVGDKVKTRGGQDVEILCIDERLKQPVVGLWDSGGNLCLATWSEDGRYLVNRADTSYDIIPLPRTVTLYRAVVRASSGRYFTLSDLFSGLDDDGIKDWNSGGCEFIRLLTEYPIEVEL